MGTLQTLQWTLWALALLTSIAAVIALVKLRLSQRFLPHFNELKELEAVLPARREELRQATEGIQKCREEIGQLEATVGHLRILKEWQNSNPEAPARIQQMMADLERSKSELAAIQLKLAQDQQALAEVTNETNRLTLEKAQLSQETTTLRDRITELRKQTADLEKTVRDLDDQHRQLETKLASLRNEIQSTENRLAALQQQVKQVEQEKAAAQRDRDQARADRDKAVAERNTALAEKTGIEKAIEQLKELAKGMQTNLRDAGVTGGGNYEALSQPISFPPLAPAPRPIEERQAFERARDYIRGRGLVFPDRILHAFHTSLKAADTSPLVVLAGISGTGKSELPRHYADGMGIHFLLTAVQPRWDSPQDLFGFYNYLERRYKATELARALVQFERYNQGEFEDAFEEAEIDDRSDRMLLVLLDEMNLARTEYYFSEFLSKLETRRMVKEDDAEDRARAEIELDMGGSVAGNNGLRLYPASNVLFVGTMNEDESTQSLSDKVIDRASVLRFGRPKKTNPVSTAGIHPAPNNGLTFEHWQRWLRKHDNLEGYAGAVDAWIDKLNDALDQLGRPFAFRVDRAIRLYLANYPRWVPDWHKCAMADQIEQRIFPKLRGIEPDQGQAAQSLRIIGSIIDELDDEPLKRAFQASHINQPTFLFRGVVRE
jgi:predicted  nucleic acid-binding Zn-ribbon protein